MSNFLEAMRYRQQHLDTLTTTGLYRGTTPPKLVEVKEEEPKEKEPRQPTKNAIQNKIDKLASSAMIFNKKTSKYVSRKNFLIGLGEYLDQFSKEESD